MTTPGSAADHLARRVLPRAVVLAARVDRPRRLGAALRRALHRSGRVELFFAFDDPAGAVAVVDLVQRLRGRDVRLVLLPVVRRGIPDDPAVEAKRRYALADAARRAGRAGLVLTRHEPLAPGDTAFLAGWVAAGPQGPALERFCVAALRRLWFAEVGANVDFAALWRRELGGDPPPPDEAARAVRRNERRMRRRGPYDTAAAWVHGRWFFAQDRVEQIGHRLDELGWAAR